MTRPRRPIVLFPLGVAIGTGLGVVFKNIPIGVALGTALGLVLVAIQRRR